jgi:hypothetical protein
MSASSAHTLLGGSQHDTPSQEPCGDVSLTVSFEVSGPPASTGSDFFLSLQPAAIVDNVISQNIKCTPRIGFPFADKSY